MRHLALALLLTSTLAYADEPAITERAVLPSADMNPERGFYQGINLLTGGIKAPAIRASGRTLAIALVRLDAFRNAPIDQTTLDALEVGFRMVRSSGIKVILRFMYNSAATPDAPLLRVLQHIGQLTALIQRNADVIAVVQAGFIGGWGEWHGSTNGLDTDINRSMIVGALLAAVPTSRSVQLRAPHFKDAISPGGPLTAREESVKNRIGHHNDCFLTTESDYGTYKSPYAFWKSYVAQEGRFTPVGGETCGVFPPRSDCPSALVELNAHHWSYLNEQYHQTVLANWQTQGCYTEVSQRLGYRLSISRFAMSKEVAPGGVAVIQMTITNTGFAAPFNARPVYLRVGDAIIFLPVDPRDWQPGNHTLSLRVRVPGATIPKAYSVYLWLPDADARLRKDSRFNLSVPGVFTLPVSAGAPGAIEINETEWKLL